MAQERPSRLAGLVEMIREQWPVLRHRAAEYAVEVREDPGLLWQSAGVRYGVYIGGGLVLLWIVMAVAGALVPPAPKGVQPRATTADFHVICQNTACGHHFVIRRDFGFRKFPVVCPKCQQPMGARAYLCTSKECRARWVVPQVIEGQSYCPECKTALSSP